MGGDRSRVYTAYGEAVHVRVSDAAVPQVSGDRGPESGLQEWNPGPRPRILSDQGVGRVGRPECASQELGAQHAEVVGEGEDGGFGMKVLNVGLE